jgi:hypothetical protein
MIELLKYQAKEDLQITNEFKVNLHTKIDYTTMIYLVYRKILSASNLSSLMKI